MLPFDLVAKRLKTFFNLKEIALEQNINDNYLFISTTSSNENVLLRHNGDVFIKKK